MGILLVMFWAGVIFLIIGTFLSSTKKDHDGTLQRISELDGLLLKEGKISDKYVVQVKLNIDEYPGHWSKGEWQMVDEIVPNPDPDVDGLLGLSKWIESDDSGKVKYRVFKLIEEIK